MVTTVGSKVYNARRGFLITQIMVVLLCISGKLTSQTNQRHTWYFGRNAAIEFTQNEVKPEQWNDSAYAGAGMYWDQSGRPLVYAGWRTVFNAGGDTLGNCRYGNNLGNPAMIMFRKPGSRDTVFAYQTYHGIPKDNLLCDYFLSEGSSTINIIDLAGERYFRKLWMVVELTT